VINPENEDKAEYRQSMTRAASIFAGAANLSNYQCVTSVGRAEHRFLPEMHRALVTDSITIHRKISRPFAFFAILLRLA
jgi:hypothetical protein